MPKTRADLVTLVAQEQGDPTFATYSRGDVQAAVNRAVRDTVREGKTNLVPVPVTLVEGQPFYDLSGVFEIREVTITETELAHMQPPARPPLPAGVRPAPPSPFPASAVAPADWTKALPQWRVIPGGVLEFSTPPDGASAALSCVVFGYQGVEDPNPDTVCTFTQQGANFVSNYVACTLRNPSDTPQGSYVGCADLSFLASLTPHVSRVYFNSTGGGVTGGVAYVVAATIDPDDPRGPGFQVITSSNFTNNAAQYVYTLGSTVKVNASDHGLAEGEAVMFAHSDGGVTAGLSYFVKDPDASNFEVTLTKGGDSVALDVGTANLWAQDEITEIPEARIEPCCVPLAAGFPVGARLDARPWRQGNGNPPALHTATRPVAAGRGGAIAASGGLGVGEVTTR